MHVTHLVKMHIEVAVTDGAKFHDQILARANREKQAALPPRLNAISTHLLLTSSGNEENKRKKKKVFWYLTFFISYKSMWRKCGFRKDKSNDYNGRSTKKELEGLETHKLLIIHYTEA